ncbi:MAG: hypothetical protein R8K49_08730 [Mariprofundaceae bacterium]
MRNFLMLVMGLLVLVGCGRKEAPQVIVDASPPVIESLNIIDIPPSNKKLEMKISGGEGGVGYQMERAEMDPYCKCPGMWERYYEEYVRDVNATKILQKIFRLNVGGHDYVYRVRAIDSVGRLGPWSQTIKASQK